MDFTGERFIPNAKNVEPHFKQKMYQEHINRYQFVIDFIKDKYVLDMGCGIGYGSIFLARNGAKNVLGIDVAKKAIHYAVTNYKRRNLFFKIGNATQTGFKDNTFDVVVCFELIEHIAEYTELLKEIQRILKSDGILIISSPKKTEEKRSEFHKYEFDFKELSDLLNQYYQNILFFNQYHVFGSLILDGSTEIKGSDISNIMNLSSFGIDNADTFIAICSQCEIDHKLTSAFAISDGDYVYHLEKDIKILKKDWEDKETKIKVLQGELENLKIGLEDKETKIKVLQGELENLKIGLEDKETKIRVLQGELENLKIGLEDKETKIRVLQGELENLKIGLEDRETKIRVLQRELEEKDDEINKLKKKYENYLLSIRSLVSSE